MRSIGIIEASMTGSAQKRLARSAHAWPAARALHGDEQEQQRDPADEMPRG